MSDIDLHAKKTALLTRMAADRAALRIGTPTNIGKTPLVSPVLQTWALPGALFLISMLRLPSFIKVPLRAFAVMSMKKQVSAFVEEASSRTSGRPLPRPAAPAPVRAVRSPSEATRRVTR